MVIEASGLGAWMGGREVLHGVSMAVREGECVALLGANGAGKTTLLRVLATLLRSESGELRLFGVRADRAGASARARLGLLGHEPMLYAGLTVRENLELFGRLYRVAAPVRRAAELIEMVELGATADTPAGLLSRGMAQRAAIARAVVHDPELLLADEPWTGLDGAAARAFGRVLARWRELGRTVVLSTHDLGQALSLAGRVVGLRGGRVVLDAPSEGMTAEGLAAAVGAPVEDAG
jgi:ABC-type multidrug transport system ATPase subunit